MVARLLGVPASRGERVLQCSALSQCWPSVWDAGPALGQHWANILRHLEAMLFTVAYVMVWPSAPRGEEIARTTDSDGFLVSRYHPEFPALPEFSSQYSSWNQYQVGCWDAWSCLSGQERLPVGFMLDQLNPLSAGTVFRRQTLTSIISLLVKFWRLKTTPHFFKSYRKLILSLRQAW